MGKLILYPNEGGVAVVIPTPEILQTRTIEEVALKDVPAGKPFKIVDESEVPTDMTFRNAWEIDPAICTDGVGAEYSVFPN